MITIDNVRSIPSLPIRKECRATKADTSRFDHLNDISISWMNKSVCLLIGSDTPDAFYELYERQGKTTEPRAIKNVLGWTIRGPSGEISINSNVSINFVSCQELHNKTKRTLNNDLYDSMDLHEEECRKENKQCNATKSTKNCRANSNDPVYRILQRRTPENKTGTTTRHRKEGYLRKKSTSKVLSKLELS